MFFFFSCFFLCFLSFRYIHEKRARVVDVFRSMDHDGGGTIDREELAWGLKKFGCELSEDGRFEFLFCFCFCFGRSCCFVVVVVVVVVVVLTLTFFFLLSLSLSTNRVHHGRLRL